MNKLDTGNSVIIVFSPMIYSLLIGEPPASGFDHVAFLLLYTKEFVTALINPRVYYTLGTIEISVLKIGFVKISVAKVGLTKISVAKVGPAKIGSVKIGPANIGPAKLGVAKSGPAKIGVADIGTAKIGSVKIGVAKIGSVKIGTAKLGPAKIGSVKIGVAKIGSVKISEAKLSLWLDLVSVDYHARRSCFTRPISLSKYSAVSDFCNYYFQETGKFTQVPSGS